MFQPGASNLLGSSRTADLIRIDPEITNQLKESGAVIFARIKLSLDIQ